MHQDACTKPARMPRFLSPLRSLALVFQFLTVLPQVQSVLGWAHTSSTPQHSVPRLPLAWESQQQHVSRHCLYKQSVCRSPHA